MAVPQAYGFMPMQQALRINAGLDNPGVMDMLGRGPDLKNGAFASSDMPSANLSQAQLPLMQGSGQGLSIDDFLLALNAKRGRDNYALSPAGPSMQRRFGAGSPLGMEMLPDEQAVPSQVGPSAEEVAQLQSALMAAAQEQGQLDPFLVTRQGTSGTYAGPALHASGTPLQAQPWYDEYLAAAQGGAALPMVRGNGHESPEMLQKRQAYGAARDKEMSGRWDMVRQNAMAKSAARRQNEMGAADPTYVKMLMEALGAANDGGMAGNAFLYGPEIAQNLHTVDMQAGMANEARREQARQADEKLNFEREQAAAQGTPYQRWAGGVLGQGIANGGDMANMLPAIAQAAPMLGFQGAPNLGSASGSMGAMPLPPMKLEQALAVSGGDPARFFQAVRSMGGNDQEAAAFYQQRTGKPANSRPGMMDQLTKKTGFLGDISLLGPAPIPWDIPGVPHLSDLLGYLQPEPAGLPARLRPQLNQQR